MGKKMDSNNHITITFDPNGGKIQKLEMCETPHAWMNTKLCIYVSSTEN